MSSPFNNGTIIGRLGADPEFRMTTEGTAVASFRIAVPDPFKKGVTHWFNGVAWRQQAEFLANYCTKGNQIAVAYHLKNEEWEDKDGNKRSAVKIEVDAVSNLTPRDDSGDEKPAKKARRDEEEEKPRKKARRDDDDDDDEKPAKKKAARDDDDDEKPAKKKRRDDDDDDEKPKKKKARRDDDDDDDDETYESV